jgi:peptidoglycan glycosyltransferase
MVLGRTNRHFFPRFRTSQTSKFYCRVSLYAALALTTALRMQGSIDLASAADAPAPNSLAVAPEDISNERDLLQNMAGQEPELLALENRERASGRTYPAPQLEVIGVDTTSNGQLRLSKRPSLTGRIGDKFASATPNNNYIFYTIDPDLQNYVSSVVDRASANHVAVVAMNPKTGAILAIAGKSPTIPDIEYHAGFPAASLFKVVTAAAAVEQAGIDTNSLIPFRGGTYTLNQHNYLPNPRADRKVMTVGEALGRSCNPVFGHIGLKYLDGSVLTRYANKFGFNQSLDFEAPLPLSSASIPHNDSFEFSRTAAGFGEVRISPVHAAALVSGIANGGVLPKPQIVDRIVNSDGVVIEKPQPEMLQRIVQPETAQSVMEMMRHTTTIGTSRREFMRGNRATLGDIDVAAKTGTLSGTNPVGLNNWFIAAAPISNPELAVAVITVDAQHSSKASHLGRLVFQRYFKVVDTAPEFTRTSSAFSPKRGKKSSKQPHSRFVGKKAPKKSVAKQSPSKKQKKTAPR